jgi:hypothetical protein
MSFSQREAVFNATMEVLQKAGIEFVPGKTVIHDVVTKEHRAQILDIVTNMFSSGQVSFSESAANQKKLSDRSELRKYVSGLVSNWHNKDKSLNAGQTYQAKTPGSRQGSGDAELKELRLLRKALVERGADTKSISSVDEAIEARQQQLGQTKKVKTNVNTELLPEELRALLG